MEALTQLLIQKYRLPPEQAKAFAAKFLLGQTPDDQAMRGEAMRMQTDIANTSMYLTAQHLHEMQANIAADPVGARQRQYAEMDAADKARDSQYSANQSRISQEKYGTPDTSPVIGYRPGGNSLAMQQMWGSDGTMRLAPLPTNSASDVDARVRADALGYQKGPPMTGPDDALPPEIQKAYLDSVKPRKKN